MERVVPRCARGGRFEVLVRNLFTIWRRKGSKAVHTTGSCQDGKTHGVVARTEKRPTLRERIEMDEDRFNAWFAFCVVVTVLWGAFLVWVLYAVVTWLVTK